MTQPRPQNTAQLILGLAIVAAGLLFTLDNLHILHARAYVHFWPTVFIVIGIAHLAQGRTSGGKMGGLIWIAIGVVLMGSQNGWWHVRIRDLGPIVLVFFGGRIIWQTLNPGRTRDVAAESESTVSAFAVMGGFDRKVVSEGFRGADLTALMGGGKLDLRDATFAGGEAIVNVFALMGGFDIRVPDTCRVVIEMMPFMGGIDDKTRTPASPSASRLIVRGFVMMGGVTIKN